MNQYFFALGTNNTLSKIDIVNMLLGKEVDFEIVEASEEILIVSTDTSLGVKDLINELGSAAKIGGILNILESKNFSENCPIGQLGEKNLNLEENLEENIREILTRQNLQSKFSRVKKFGIGVYGAGGGKLREVDEVFGRV